MQRRTIHWHRITGFVLVLLTASACFQAWGGDLVATQQGVQAPTYTPFPSNTPFPTAAPLETNTPTTTDPFALLTPATIDPLLLAQFITPDPLSETMTAQALIDNSQLDPFAMTATAWIVQNTAVPLTQTAIALGITGPTATPQPGAISQPQVLVPGADCIHEVRATDRNLYRIAQNYGVTFQEIAQANNLLNPDLIYVGDELVIPGCGTTGVTPLPTSTSLPGAIQATAVPAAAQNGTGFLAVTFTPVPGIGTTGAITSTGGRTHIVRQGETLYQIAVQYGVSVHDIAAVNGLPNLNIIYIGDELTIP